MSPGWFVKKTVPWALRDWPRRASPTYPQLVHALHHPRDAFAAWSEGRGYRIAMEAGRADPAELHRHRTRIRVACGPLWTIRAFYAVKVTSARRVCVPS